MTNEQAIKILVGNRNFYERIVRPYDREMVEALNMAIKALEGQEQSKKPKCPNSYNCGDCIHAQGVWEGLAFRGIRCLKGCK